LLAVRQHCGLSQRARDDASWVLWPADSSWKKMSVVTFGLVPLVLSERDNFVTSYHHGHHQSGWWVKETRDIATSSNGVDVACDTLKSFDAFSQPISPLSHFACPLVAMFDDQTFVCIYFK